MGPETLERLTTTLPGKAAAEGAAPARDESHDDARMPLGAQMRMMLRFLVRTSVSRALALLIAAIFAVVVATAYGQILLNSWNKPFFDAISHQDLEEFVHQLGVFLLIAGVLLVLNVAQRWLVEMLKLKLREGLVKNLLRGWMQPGCAFQLADAGAIGVNPDQRIHEDARKLCELSADLGTGLLQASILFVIFSSVLWVLSEKFSIAIGAHNYAIPGFLLWSAIAYAGFGSFLSYRVGHGLINRNAERYAREAELRSSLVWVNEHIDGISLAGGEADEERRLEIELGQVLGATRRLVTGLTRLTWVTAGFGWVTNVAPILLASPLYFDGKISFGGLMMAAAAFTQAQSSLRWFVDNFSVIADWRATLMRVANFRLALTTSAVAHDLGERIGYAEGEPGQIRIDHLQILSSGGWNRMRESQVSVRPGDRVLIVGAPGNGKTLLFRALAGLWPWGKGTITHPRGEMLHYLSRGTPYLPRGTLREVLAYPQGVDSFHEMAYQHTLQRMGLDRLVPLLDANQRWDRVLGQNEQLCLAFAVVLLQAPQWLLVDDIFSGMDDDALERVYDVLANELRHTGMIYIGRAGQAHGALFTRILHLVSPDAAGEPSP